MENLAYISSLRKPRILVVTHNLHYEGAPQSLLSIVKALDPKEYKFFVCSGTEGDLAEEYEKLGAVIVEAGSRIWPHLKSGPEDISRNFRQFTNVLKAYDIDLVLSNTLLTHWAVLAADQLGIPSIWCIRESIENADSLSAPQRLALQLASRVVFCSNTTREKYKAFSRDNFATIFNGIDLDALDAFREKSSTEDLHSVYDIPKDKTVISIIGTPCGRKGHHLLLESAKKLAEQFDDLLFLVVGAQPYFTQYTADFRQAVAQSTPEGLFRIVERTDFVYPYYALSDIVAVPSWNESFPRVVLESMAFAKAIVAFSSWGITEQISHEETGLLVTPGDVSGLTEAFARLIEDPLLRKRFGEAAHEDMHRRFFIKNMTDPYVDLIRSHVKQGYQAVPEQLTTGEDHLEEVVEALFAEPDIESWRTASEFLERHKETVSHVSLLRILGLAVDHIRKILDDNYMPPTIANPDELNNEIRFLRNAIKNTIETRELRLGQAKDFFDRAVFQDLILENLRGDNVVAKEACLDRSCIKGSSFHLARFEDLFAASSKWKENNLSLCEFHRGRLVQSSFERCWAKGAFFKQLDLSRSIFNETSLQHAFFVDSLLGGSRFVGCDLTNARFDRCHFEQTEFEDCSFDQCEFINCVFDTKTKINGKSVIESVGANTPRFTDTLGGLGLPRYQQRDSKGQSDVQNQNIEKNGPEFSLLVVSRNPEQMTDLLRSIEASAADFTLEVLCAWNGTDTDRRIVENVAVSFPLKILEIRPYHFASNNNLLASEAQGEVLVFVNDDMILDPDCLSNAYRHLLQPKVGLVGANLRARDGRVQHAGIYFNSNFRSYHRYKYLLDYQDDFFSESCFVPAVTGAFMMIRKSDFNSLRFEESFSVCGEDILLCVQVRKNLKKEVIYAADATAIHYEGATRVKTREQGVPSQDMEKIVKGIYSVYSE